MDLLCGRYQEKIKKSRGKTVKILGICRGKKWEVNQKAMQRGNARLAEALWDFRQVLPASLQPDSLLHFIEQEIAQIYQALWRSDGIGKDLFCGFALQPEDLYFAWLQSRVFARFFQPAFAAWLDVAPEEMVLLSQKNWFTEKPSAIGAAFAFLAVDSGKEQQIPCLVEVQPGFDGIAAVDRWALIRAEKLWREEGVYTLRAVMNRAEKTITLLPLPAINLAAYEEEAASYLWFMTEKEQAAQGLVWHLCQAPPAAADWLASLANSAAK